VDPDALAERLPAYRGVLLGYVRGMVRDQALAEDVVQDTMLRALERGASLREPEALGAWLFRIAHRRAVDAVRGVREQPQEDVGELVEARWREDSYTVDAQAVVERAADREELLDALVHLPAGVRSVLLLHDAQEWTSKEVAAELGLSVPAVKQRVRRGRMMLVSALAVGHERRAALAGVPLRCWDARRQVGAYLDGERAATSVTMLESHLADCPTCPPLVASLVSTRTQLRRLGPWQDRDDVVDAGTADAIRRRTAGA
jgi:RNA polymerase sigma-70 factor (ECF subfamily)